MSIVINGDGQISGLDADGISSQPVFPGQVLQVQTTNTDGLLTASTGGSPSTITNGVQVFSLSFTPKSATSTILVQTSSIAIEELVNSGDVMWLALWDGSTFVCATSGTWGAAKFGSFLDSAYHTLNATFTAGSASARTISVRAGANAGNSVYINNSTGAYSGTSNLMSMTVWEIAA